MPVTLYTNPFRSGRQTRTDGHCSAEPVECRLPSSRTITIGLVNNMLDGALEATERQFLSLLESASDGISIRLLLYSLPGVPRNVPDTRLMLDAYASVDTLWDTQLDGLIVTGREPVTANLADEPYWKSFTRLVDWARDNTYSTIWSCLAAHAAIQYMDDIRRVKNDRKHCGVFDCAKVSDHPLIAGTPSRFKLPHSRWNGVLAEQLTERGYRVLTQAAEVGVDTFIQQNKSLFVFFQGHPEYESNTLLLEYRRDVGRYLRGEAETYPRMPQGYFGRDTIAALTALQQEAEASRREEMLAEVTQRLKSVNIEYAWRPTATGIYRNWLEHICAQKEQRLRASNVVAAAHRTDDSIPVMGTATGTFA